MIQRHSRKFDSFANLNVRAVVAALSLAALSQLGMTARTLAADAAVGVSPAQTIRIDQLRDFTVQDITMPSTASGVVDLPVSLDHATYVMRLQPHSVRSAEFDIRVQRADGSWVEGANPATATWRGWLEGAADSHVAATIKNGQVSATILDGTGEQWHVQPADEVVAGAAATSHLIYRASDLLWSSGHCEEDGHASPINTFAARTFSTGGAAAGGSYKVCDIAFDADFEYYQLNGNSVAGVVGDIENIMNQVSMIYESQANLTYEITTIVIRTGEPDPYTTTENQQLLIQFKNEWNTNMQGVHRDVAHLMTGKQIDGTVIGTAYNGSVCEVCGSAEGYGFSQSLFEPFLVSRVCLTAHELGHNWGASHCDADSQCAIMCSINGGCSGNCSSFEPGSLNVIMSGINSASCLSTLADPHLPPFCDRFDAVISSTNWSFNAAAGISGASLNPPSGPNTLVLNTCCTPCAAAPDDLRSNFILLGNTNHATLAYYTEHGGGAGTNGAQLVVDYFNSAGTWVELNRITSNGLSQSTFDHWSHSLPADALHNQFRMRFRLASSTNQPNWFIDDVSVMLVESNSPILYVMQSAPAGGSGTSWASPYSDLQDALDAARCSSGVINEIWVAAGTYRPDRGTNDRTATFTLFNGLDLIGGFSGFESVVTQRNPQLHETVLTGAIGLASPTDNSFHVVTTGGTDRSAVLDGFTITSGYAGNSSPNNSGAGIYNVAGSPTIRNCVITNNRATSAGGMLNSTGSSPLMQGCTFRGNFATSISGGAMSNTLGSTPILERCAFLGNNAAFTGGAIQTATSNVTISDSIFVGNTGMSGAAIYNSSSSATLTNCSVVQNVASNAVGGVFDSGSSTTLLNSIVWNNSDNTGTGEGAQLSAASAFADYSCIKDANPNDATVFPGVSNIDDDPQFVRNPNHGGDGWGVGNNDDYGDLRLVTASPCVDSGDPTFAFTWGEFDLEGHARVLCDVVDRGAYESGIGDIECDDDVNLTDFVDWSDCYTGPNGGPYLSGCESFDFDFDGDVDLNDHAAFGNLFPVP